jgi:hypothetical protein
MNNTQESITYGDNWYPRKPFMGHFSVAWPDKMLRRRCDRCGTPVGSPHVLGCGAEYCPVCDGPLVHCTHWPNPPNPAFLSAYRGIWSWSVRRCVLCAGRHFHGGGKLADDPRSFLGHRASHCFIPARKGDRFGQSGGDYVIVDGDPAEADRVIQRVRRSLAGGAR